MEPAEKLIVFCDGGARGNPGPAASGCVIKNSAGKTRFLCGKYLGETTNNQAEYQAVKLALEVIKSNFEGKLELDFFLDSELVVKQLSGLYKIKNHQLRRLVEEIRNLEKFFGRISYQHIRREKNSLADSLVNKAIDLKSEFLESIEI